MMEYIVILILVVLVIIFLSLIKIENITDYILSNNKKENTTDSSILNSKEKKTQYYNIKLYLSNGTIVLEEKKVALEHWDKNIYIIYDYKGKYIKRIHKGNNMLLLCEPIISDSQ